MADRPSPQRAEIERLEAGADAARGATAPEQAKARALWDAIAALPIRYGSVMRLDVLQLVERYVDDLGERASPSSVSATTPDTVRLDALIAMGARVVQEASGFYVRWMEGFVPRSTDDYADPRQAIDAMSRDLKGETPPSGGTAGATTPEGPK